MGDLRALPDPREPEPDIVKGAERLLELAKSGQIESVGWAVSYRDGSTGTLYGSARTWDLARLIGAVEHLKFRLMRRFEGE